MKKISYHGMELLPVKHDIVFKAVFGKNDSRDILAKFLSAILEIDIDQPELIEYTNTELSPDFAEDKLSRFDVRARLSDGTHVEIEVQIQDEKDMIMRALYYEAKLFQDQMRSGQGYDELSRAITQNILDYILLEEESYHNRYRYMNCDTGVTLSNLCEINFLELPKVPEKCYNEKVAWALLFATDKEEVIDMLAKDNKDIEKAVEKLKYVTADDIERFRIDQIEKARMDYAARMRQNYRRGKEEGLAEGLEQGIQQGIERGIEKGARLAKFDMAKALIGKIDDSEIIDLIGISQDELDELK